MRRYKFCAIYANKNAESVKKVQSLSQELSIWVLEPYCKSIQILC